MFVIINIDDLHFGVVVHNLFQLLDVRERVILVLAHAFEDFIDGQRVLLSLIDYSPDSSHDAGNLVLLSVIGSISIPIALAA